MSKILVSFLLLVLLCALSSPIPLRSLFLRSYDDMNQESLARGLVSGEAVDGEDSGDNRPKRGLDLLKRRVEIIERNRCFFNPITCY